jgi:uncharacterized protein
MAARFKANARPIPTTCSPRGRAERQGLPGRRHRAAARRGRHGALHRPLPQGGHRRTRRGPGHSRSATGWSRWPIDERRAAILASLKERNLLTPGTRKGASPPTRLTALEDIYLPFRPKKRTRATIAKEKGLEPLAELLWAQDPPPTPPPPRRPTSAANTPPTTARTRRPKIASTEEALAGARDILAERVSDDKDARARSAPLSRRTPSSPPRSSPARKPIPRGRQVQGLLRVERAARQGPQSHRVLAMRRGEKELFLMMRVHAARRGRRLRRGAAALREGQDSPPPPTRSASPCRTPASACSAPRWKPRCGSSRRSAPTRPASRSSPTTCASCCSPPRSARRPSWRSTPASAPAARSSCSIARASCCTTTSSFPTATPVEAKEKIKGFVKFFNVEAIAIGNGTAGRETEAFVRGLGCPPAIPIVMVNESGASIYSASEVAREEFPDHDLTVRGAVSIGRRLMDPLAELVKLDPKSIGVGQYQHDVDQSALKRSLDDTVISSVNGVGVELNTASKQLLSYVSGLNAATPPRSSRAATKRAPSSRAPTPQGRAAPRPEGLRAGRRLPPHPRRRAPARRQRRAPGALRPRRKDGRRPRRHRRRSHARREAARQDQAGEVRHRRGRPAHAHDIMAELAKPGRDPRAEVRGVQLHRRASTSPRT